MNSANFKIENFCSEHNEEFKVYYGYLNNPIYITIFMYHLQFMNDERMKNKVKEMIKNNKKYIYDRLDIIDTVIYYYEQNNLIRTSEIGHFFKYYQNYRSKINLKNKKRLSGDN
jgi:hypothetical protein